MPIIIETRFMAPLAIESGASLVYHPSPDARVGGRPVRVGAAGWGSRPENLLPCHRAWPDGQGCAHGAKDMPALVRRCLEPRVPRGEGPL